MPNVDPDQRLNQLFASYREALPDPEASANFMPELWGRIESRRRNALTFRRLSRVFVMGSAAASFALALLVMNPPRRPDSPVYQATYVETLGSASPAEVVVEEVDASLDGDPVETDLI